MSRPQNSNKSLYDFYQDKIKISWSYDSLKEKQLSVWDVPKVSWFVETIAEVNGTRIENLTWSRLESGVPGFVCKGSACGAQVVLTGISTKSGDAVKAEFHNNSGSAVVCRLSSEHKNGWILSNPGYIDGKNSNTLTAMQYERPDRLLMIAFGADAYIVDMSKLGVLDTVVPLNSLYDDNRQIAEKTLSMEFSLEPGEIKTGWLIRPYKKYIGDIIKLNQLNWQKEFDSAHQEWIDFIAKGATPIIPEPDVIKAYRACLSDLFVMSEPAKDGYMAICCGTELYRSTNSAEPALTAKLWAQLGYIKEAYKEMWLHIDAQGKDGDWNDPQGWGHHMWALSGFKVQMVMEYFKITKDYNFLKTVYPRLKKASLWQHRMRNQTRKDKNSVYYGLMPRGMGDAGVSDGNDYFGIFYPHNCMAVLLDKMALEAAVILNLKEDIKLLDRIYTTSSRDLITSLRKGAIHESDHSWIPGTANKTCGSSWGSLFSLYPCDLLKGDDPLITGTIKHIEKRISEGGQPTGTGWLQDGCWVSATLDDLAQTLLYMKDGDNASKYLYSTINHASKLITWCEERGVEKNSPEISGDLQHLWTPLAVTKYIRNALVCNIGDSLCLALGTPRQWLKNGYTVGILNAKTHFGDISYTINRKNSGLFIKITGTEDIIGKKLEISLRLPDIGYYLMLTAVDGGNAYINGEIIFFEPSLPQSNLEVSIK